MRQKEIISVSILFPTDPIRVRSHRCDCVEATQVAAVPESFGMQQALDQKKKKSSFSSRIKQNCAQKKFPLERCGGGGGSCFGGPPAFGELDHFVVRVRIEFDRVVLAVLHGQLLEAAVDGRPVAEQVAQVQLLVSRLAATSTWTIQIDCIALHEPPHGPSSTISNNFKSNLNSNQMSK